MQLHAWSSGSERRFYNGPDLKVDGSTLTQTLLLRPSKQQIEEVKSKIQAENSETRATPKRVPGFVLCIAPPSLSRGRRIKMEKSIKIHDVSRKLEHTQKFFKRKRHKNSPVYVK